MPDGGVSEQSIRVVRALAGGEVDRLYSLYRAAFEPLRVVAAARHMLTSEEFGAELADSRIDKYLAFRDGKVIGITTVAADLEAVPWIEPLFYRTRYPDAAGRGALYYLMFTFVDPQVATFRLFLDMMNAVCARLIEERAVIGMDFSDHNANGAVGRFVQSLPRRFGATVQGADVRYPVLGRAAASRIAPSLDRQHYVVADFRNLPTGPATPAVPRPRASGEQTVPGSVG